MILDRSDGRVTNGEVGVRLKLVRCAVVFSERFSDVSASMMKSGIMAVKSPRLANRATVA